MGRRRLVAAVLAGCLVIAAAVGGSAHGSASIGPVVALVDDQGQVCVIFVTTDAHPVSCRAPGARGYRITGLPAHAGLADAPTVANVGDVNGDGIDDFAIGVADASFDGRARSGVTYVVFGSASRTTVDVGNLGSRGFVIGGAVAGDGAAVLDETDNIAGRGDVNGDGLDDILVTSFNASTNGHKSNGAAWVVFGKADAAPVDLADLGAGGFRIDGASAEDSLGNVAIAGDLNGDGRDDIVDEAGDVLVVLGKTTPDPVELADLGTAGYTIRGLGPGTGAEATAVGIGDVNGDHLDDLLVSKYDSRERVTDVVFGRRSGASLDLHRLGSDGLTITPREPHSAFFGLAGAGPGRLVPGGPPGFAVTDDTNVYVITRHHGRATVDLHKHDFGGRVLTYPQSFGNSEPVPIVPIGLEAPDSARGHGDLLVEEWVYKRSAYRDFVVFGHSGGGTVDLRHLGHGGFEITHTIDSVRR